MDNRANLHESLFSRNSTPPTSPPQHQPFPSSQHISNNSSPNLIDTLFQNISPPAQTEQHQAPHSAISEPHPADSYHDTSGVASVMSLTEDTAISPTTIADRQNSLLSLIGASSTVRSQPLPQPVQQQPQSQPQQQQPQQQPAPQPQPQQIPTPPASSQRSNASPPQTETQKMLEQMIGGTSSRSTNYSDTQRNSSQQQSAPSPPYSQHSQQGEYRNFNQYDQGSDTSPRARPIQHPNVPPPPPQSQQTQPPSPRRSMFEFTSAFDHLSSTTNTVKKKPVPAQPSSIHSGNEDSASWSAPAIDPKRQSVENLLENLTRGQPQSVQPQPPAYESYLSGSDFSQIDPASSRAPLPPIPSGKPVAIPNRTSSPRDSSPKNQSLHRPQPRPVDQQTSYTTGLPYPPGTRIEKEGSPGPRGNGGRQLKAAQLQPQPQVQPQPKFSGSTKSQPSSGFQAQVINFDVSQALEEIQAREAVKWTPIALVKQDSVFLPGTTIGATHWVAYAMTRGRVRVISRSSGDRTLLQLPQVFSITTSVIDMAVYGNRLAGVTSDGGFVVWELPELIMDDVPGRVLLCVPPTNDPHDAIRGVKWHPKEADTLAIAADDKIFVIDLVNTHALHGQPLPHSDLHHIGQLFNVHSTIVAFDFDVANFAIATISEDSSLAIWNLHDSRPYTVQKIPGDEVPSSLTFLDGGIVVGRKNGTVFQLLSRSSKTLLSTVNFINGAQEDPEMFGHITYDSRIQTLWVANSRRESLIALKIQVEPSFGSGEDGGFVDQVAEFSGIKPTIHFVILTADADPHGDEAHAACVAAKVPPGELALVGFSVHSTGVDQVLIRKEWFDTALMQAESKYPFETSLHLSNVLGLENKPRQPLPPIPQPVVPQPPSNSSSYTTLRARTPPSDDVENEFSEGRSTDQKGKGAKNKNVNWKEKEETNRDKNFKPADTVIINDSALGQALSKEIKKTEENLHSRIGKLIGKEMDKQHQRFEETRLHEQAEDFARQEKILKLISTELTRNTTRVVEMAVKNEVQNSVLPSLENITRNEVKAALNDQIGISLVDVINRSLPVEMEKLVLRPTISNHFTNVLSTALTPMVEHHIKEILTTTFFQFHSNQTAAMHQDLLRELRGEIAAIKSELGNWHSESMRGQEATIRDLEHTVRALSEQVKFLSIGNAAPSIQPTIQHLPPPQQSQQTSPSGPSVPQQRGNMDTTHLRQNVPPASQPIPTYMHNHSTYQQPPPPQQQQQPHHIQQQQQWYNAIAAPQPSVPASLPQAPVPPPQQERTPPLKSDQWDENYLSVLHSQDSTKLRDVLSRTNPDLVFPLNGQLLVSQAVVLTLIHRLSAVVGDTSPNDETFKTSLWWLQRTASLLRPDDKLISDFIPRVIPTVQQSLNTTKQRLAILPGGPGTMETAQALSNIQESLRRKVGQQ